MNHLLREFAPISSTGWDQIEGEARTRLVTYLSGRRLVDFSGPHGWQHSATDLRSTEIVPVTDGDVQVRRRRVLPLIEMRVEFDVSRRELENAERGARNIDLSGLEEAAEKIALGENKAIFHGFGEVGIVGIAEASSHEPVTVSGGIEGYAPAVARAVNVLKLAGIGGPFGLVIGPEGYTRIAETIEAGVALSSHLGRILDGPVVWAPGVEGAIVLSTRGGDFELDSGADLGIGYLHHDADVVRLYFEESFSFRVLEPDAAVVVR